MLILFIIIGSFYVWSCFIVQVSFKMDIALISCGLDSIVRSSQKLIWHLLHVHVCSVCWALLLWFSTEDERVDSWEVWWMMDGKIICIFWFTFLNQSCCVMSCYQHPSGVLVIVVPAPSFLSLDSVHVKGRVVLEEGCEETIHAQFTSCPVSLWLSSAGCFCSWLSWRGWPQQRSWRVLQSESFEYKGKCATAAHFLSQLPPPLASPCWYSSSLLDSLLRKLLTHLNCGMT